MTNSINLSPLNDDDTIIITTSSEASDLIDIDLTDLDLDFPYPYMGGGGAMGAAQPYVGVTGGSGWPGTLNITDTYNLSNHADIMVGDTSLRDWMKTVNDRLSILQPNPRLLEKFTALQQAYEHYRTLEALLHGQDQDETPD
jgi:hypothetical protein